MSTSAEGRPVAPLPDDVAPCRVGPDGGLELEGLSLERLARELEGRAAWVFGRAALEPALSRGGCVPVTSLGSPELLALAADAGCWAEVGSAHELRLALQVGFAPSRVRAVGAVKEDGYVKDALAAEVGALVPGDEGDAANVARIAAVLGCPVPPASAGPAALAPEAFAGTGGLLAPVLRPGPDVHVDALLPEGGPLDLVPLLPGAPVPGTVSGLGGRRRVARLHGPLRRGEWVFVPEPGAAAARAPDLAHPEPVIVLVRDGRWRELSARPLPLAPGSGD